MLSADDHPGIVTFLIGLIVVVMVGLGLSLLVDHRFEFSRGEIAIETSIEQDAKILDDLRGQHTQRSQRVASLLQHRREGSEGYAAEVDRLGQCSANMSRLAAVRSALEQDLTTLEQDFASYRANYRRSAWAAAVGQKIPLLKTNGGREYREVTIIRVTEVGLEVKHSDGMARIEAPALGLEWQQRMQWNDEERRAQLVAERRASAVAAKPASPLQPQPAETNEALRAAFTVARAKVETLKRELAMAKGNQLNSSKRSLPGSLETWDERTQRLAAELEKAELRYEQAKTRLKARSPQDPALQPAPPFPPP